MKDTDTVRKRLKNEYLIHGSYARLAAFYDVNARYLWDFIKNGVVPPKNIWHKIRCAWWVSEAVGNLTELRKQKEQSDEHHNPG